MPVSVFFPMASRNSEKPGGASVSANTLGGRLLPQPHRCPRRRYSVGARSRTRTLIIPVDPGGVQVGFRSYLRDLNLYARFGDNRQETPFKGETS
jgi:hypothetical protein